MSTFNSGTNIFSIQTDIIKSTFNKNLILYKRVENSLKTLDSNIQEIDLNAYLTDVYDMGFRNYQRLKLISNDRRAYLELHQMHVEMLVKFFQYQRSLLSSGFINPYCPVLNLHPLITDSNKLWLNKDVVLNCSSERKGKISAGYGEGIARLLLEQLDDVSPFGVLRVSKSNKKQFSTPDFIIVNRYLKIVAITEVKSSINNKMVSTARQAKQTRFSGLGVNVFFNLYDNSPVDIKIVDPEVTLDMDVSPSIYAYMSMAQAHISMREESPLEFFDQEWIRRLVHKFEEDILIKMVENREDLWKVEKQDEEVEQVDQWLDTENEELKLFLKEYLYSDKNSKLFVFKSH
ncbi:hypothetical protein HF638_04410 [Paenibacillus sp. SZ31]|uniref:hypothetical protein n=1 Tax=Paenibacillus sp. SZ31 TaxID=2725555 RepID=UPI00146F559F|nr:hypothetical protein [Paenibacillus sp. SZ31]NMI03203.1 hypothetical protein [Paenibacillus sp. SZ31]